MNNVRDMNRRGGDIIGLLVLFILALLAAHFTVALKSAIKLSEPIPLAHAGLSVSMPVGNGWHSEKQWMFYDNSFIASSIFVPHSGESKDDLRRATAWARCQYHWAMKKAAPEDRFAWKASEVIGKIVETGRTQVQNLTVDWARIEKPDFLLTAFWGTAELPNGRQLDIEVHQIMSDPELPRRVFDRILKNVSFEEDPLLKAGTEIVTTIKDKGLDRYIDKEAQRTLFLIKDSTEQSIGFTIDILVGTGQYDPPNVRGAGFLYMRGRTTGQQETTFQSSNHLDEFTYQSRTYSDEEKSGREIAFDKAGTMTVRKFGLETKVKKYYPGPAALPDIFSDHVLRQMLDSDKREIIVDFIDSSGDIIPTYISRIEAETPEAAYVFDLEFLDGQGSSQKVYLDEQKQAYKNLVRQKHQYVFERTNIEKITKEFPEHAQWILQNSQNFK